MSEEISTEEIYRQQCAHFRGMNELLYKLPSIFSALIAGVWFFAFEQIAERPFLTDLVMVFAAFFAWSSRHVMHRFGAAFSAYIDNINRMDGDLRVTLRDVKGPSTVKIINRLLLLAAGVSLSVPIWHLGHEAAKFARF